MRRRLAIAVLSAALSVPLVAQVRVTGGASRPMGPVRVAPVAPMRTMAAPRPMGSFGVPIVRRGSGPTFVTTSPFVFNPACDPFVFQCSPPFISVFNGFHFRRFRFGHFGRFNQFGFSPFGFSPFGFSSFGVSPFLGYPIFSSDYGNQVMQPAVAPQPIIIYAQPPPSERETEQEARPAPREEPAPAAKPAEPLPVEPVILIFRDHRREEVTNYAIAGDTLWVFSAHARRKIALSDLDIPATEKANDDRGVDFRVPVARKGT